jgi:hypothetical protein
MGAHQRLPPVAAAATGGAPDGRADGLTSGRVTSRPVQGCPDAGGLLHGNTRTRSRPQPVPSL